MLRSLNIENIAVIEKCNIEFGDGFNVLTGETGAGKSIIIDSINAVTGHRTSKESVRTGCDRASVTALFEALTEAALQKITDYGIDTSDGTVLMVRTLTADGRSTCKINGVTVNTSAMRDIGEFLVNIHGQHDNQALLNPERHLSFVDSYGDYGDIAEKYKDCYGKLKAVRKELKSVKTDESEKARRIDILKYQINEIDAAAVVPGQLSELKSKRELMRNSEKIRLALDTCTALLQGDDDTVGAETACSQAVAEFSSVSKVLPGTEKLLERFDFVAAELSEISAEIRSLAENTAFDPNELFETEQRIDLLNELGKKYGGSEEAVLEFAEKAKAELDGIIESDDRISVLEAESEMLEDELVEIAGKLTEARRKTADIFASRVCEVLKYLEMPDVVFTVSIKPRIYTVDGCDDVEFLISANRGQEARPLAKIASGGELSRTMLAIKSVLTADDGAATLIFDEIDTGISGKAADKVGRQMKKLSKQRQVLCVTHLAQIAAAADSNFLIKKSSADNNTYTNVLPLSGDERIKEIARIMSGGNMTENLYNSAKELIDNHRDL